jgi:hypothetical protein
MLTSQSLLVLVVEMVEQVLQQLLVQNLRLLVEAGVAAIPMANIKMPLEDKAVLAVLLAGTSHSQKWKVMFLVQ